MSTWDANVAWSKIMSTSSSLFTSFTGSFFSSPASSTLVAHLLHFFWLALVCLPLLNALTTVTSMRDVRDVLVLWVVFRNMVPQTTSKYHTHSPNNCQWSSFPHPFQFQLSLPLSMRWWMGGKIQTSLHFHIPLAPLEKILRPVLTYSKFTLPLSSLCPTHLICTQILCDWRERLPIWLCQLSQALNCHVHSLANFSSSVASIVAHSNKKLKTSLNHPSVVVMDS